MPKTATKHKSKKIRKGDKVVVITGNNRGQTGTVMKCMGDRVVVQGINMKKKHVKPTQENPKGSIIDIERSIHISNIQVCGVDDKPIKLKVKYNGDGEKTLYYLVDGKETTYRSMKKHIPA